MVLQNYPSFGFVGFGSKFLYLLRCGKDIVYYANCSFQKKQIVLLTAKGLNLQNSEISVRRWFVREVESEGRNQWTRERRFVLF